jgi:hypothetical protein
MKPVNLNAFYTLHFIIKDIKEYEMDGPNITNGRDEKCINILIT